MAIRKRKIQASYIKIDNKFELCGTGFTELTESFGAQTTSKRYIDQASATQSITGYEWSSSFTADQIVNNKVTEYILTIAEEEKLGTETETEYLIIDLDKEATGSTQSAPAYRARKRTIAISVDSTSDNDSELGMSGTFLGMSDVTVGTATIGSNGEITFSEGFTPKTA